MGRLRSVNALANILVGAAIYGLARFMGYTAMFAALGGVAVACGLWALTRDPSQTDLPVQRKKMTFRRKYWLYYALTFLSGARRQVFVAFAVYLLVSKFGYTIRQVTVLFVLNNVINYFANPMIGRAVNRFGERAVLSIEYGTLTLVFLGYAFTESALLAGVLYVVDNIVYNFAMGIKTFYQKIAAPEDIASGMAVGVHHQPHRGGFRPVRGRAAVDGALPHRFSGRGGPVRDLAHPDPMHPCAAEKGSSSRLTWPDSNVRSNNESRPQPLRT